MVGVGTSLLKVTSRSRFEFSKTDEGGEELEDGNQTKVIGPAFGRNFSGMSQMGPEQPVMKETIFEMSKSEYCQPDQVGPGSEVFPGVILDHIIQCNFCDQAFSLLTLKSLQ